jgi:hypothetical protein
MLYPWPLDVDGNLLSEALEIAMDYLERTGQAYPFSAVQQLCAFTINNAWRDGRRHKRRLANDAVRAVEKAASRNAVVLSAGFLAFCAFIFRFARGLRERLF